MSPNSEICHVFNFMNTTSITRVFSSFAPFGDGSLNALEPKRADQLTDGQMTRYFLNLLAPSFLLLPITKKSKANTQAKKSQNKRFPKTGSTKKITGATAALMAVSEILTRLLLRQVNLKYHPHSQKHNSLSLSGKSEAAAAPGRRRHHQSDHFQMSQHCLLCW